MSTCGMIELAVEEMRGRATIVAGVGSNDTRHAVQLTERATELGADALLSVNPYYNRPSRRGIVRHYEEVSRATDLPILLYNIPQRTGSDMPNDLLAELAQLDNIVGVKQANPDNLAKIDGLQIYAGNDDLLADVLDWASRAGSSSRATSSARRCAGWSTSPSTAARSTPACRTSTATWGSRRWPARPRRR